MSREVPTEAQAQAMRSCLVERDNQNRMFGEQQHDPAYWLAILGKQVGQLGQQVLNYKWAANEWAKGRAYSGMYDECTQIMAVAMAVMEALDEGKLIDEVTTAKPADRRQLNQAVERDDESMHSMHYDEMP